MGAYGNPFYVACTGYKHKLKKDKTIMEAKEKELMKILGYPDPYYAN